PRHSPAAHSPRQWRRNDRRGVRRWQRGLRTVVSSDDLQHLFGGSLAFVSGGFPHLHAGELRVAECEAMEAIAQNVLRRGLAVLAEEEPRRVDDVRVTPT